VAALGIRFRPNYKSEAWNGRLDRQEHGREDFAGLRILLQNTKGWKVWLRVEIEVAVESSGKVQEQHAVCVARHFGEWLRTLWVDKRAETCGHVGDRGAVEVSHRNGDAHCLRRAVRRWVRTLESLLASFFDAELVHIAPGLSTSARALVRLAHSFDADGVGEVCPTRCTVSILIALRALVIEENAARNRGASRSYKKETRFN
jgi:hypothetical protein